MFNWHRVTLSGAVLFLIGSALLVPMAQAACYNLVALQYSRERISMSSERAAPGTSETHPGWNLVCAVGETTRTSAHAAREVVWAEWNNAPTNRQAQNVLALISKPDARDTDFYYALLLTHEPSGGELQEPLYDAVNNAQSLVFIARDFEARGELDLAARFYLKAGLVAPSEMPHVSQIALWFIQQHRYQDALRVAEQALELHPTDSTLKILSAQALLGVGKVTQARILLESLIELEPSTTVYLLLGQAYYEEGNWSAAHLAEQRALNLDPENLWAMQWLGRALEKENKKEEAKMWWQRALALDPQFQPAKDALGIH